MESIIKINNLKVMATHGVLDFEKTTPQPFIFSLDLYVDYYKASENDDLNLSISYCDIMQDISNFATTNTFNLIETLAYKTALLLLNKYDKIKRIILEVKKPEAPFDMDFEYVSTKVDLKWENVYLSLGSNLGDKEKNLNSAIALLNSDDTKVEKISSILVNPPYGGVATEEFYNMAVKVKTVLSPYELLDKIHDIESILHRVRDVRWGNRTLDIDIIFFGNISINEENLTIPHKDYKNRDFVLIPLKEIAPHLF